MAGDKLRVTTRRSPTVVVRMSLSKSELAED